MTALKLMFKISGSFIDIIYIISVSCGRRDISYSVKTYPISDKFSCIPAVGQSMPSAGSSNRNVASA